MNRIFVLILTCTWVSCDSGSESEVCESIIETVKNKDTLVNQSDVQIIDTNKVGANGLKQSYWYFLGIDMPERGYGDYDTIEEGYFHDGQKVGIWTYYGKDGTVDSVVAY